MKIQAMGNETTITKIVKDSFLKGRDRRRAVPKIYGRARARLTETAVENLRVFVDGSPVNIVN